MDEKQNLATILYGRGLISGNGVEAPAVVALSGSDFSNVDSTGITLGQAGIERANFRAPK